MLPQGMGGTFRVMVVGGLRRPRVLPKAHRSRPSPPASLASHRSYVTEESPFRKTYERGLPSARKASAVYTPPTMILFPPVVPLVGPLLRPIKRKGHGKEGRLRKSLGSGKEIKKGQNGRSLAALHFQNLIEQLKYMSKETTSPKEMVEGIRGILWPSKETLNHALRIGALRLLWRSIPVMWIKEQGVREVLFEAELEVRESAVNDLSPQLILSLTSAKITSLARSGLTQDALRYQVEMDAMNSQTQSELPKGVYTRVVEALLSPPKLSSRKKSSSLEHTTRIKQAIKFINLRNTPKTPSGQWINNPLVAKAAIQWAQTHLDDGGKRVALDLVDMHIHHHGPGAWWAWEVRFRLATSIRVITRMLMEAKGTEHERTIQSAPAQVSLLYHTHRLDPTRLGQVWSLMQNQMLQAGTEPEARIRALYLGYILRGPKVPEALRAAVDLGEDLSLSSAHTILIRAIRAYRHAMDPAERSFLHEGIWGIWGTGSRFLGDEGCVQEMIGFLEACGDRQALKDLRRDFARLGQAKSKDR
ncbi:hypothetical protein BJ684DRAFT_15689 [Piptocephalis cylindrospora]|uniref:Uncharacterized protein n=1 Tax=Piptocephalis cylindrospora TaxID=1907219 RepID=A0A4P9Y4W2_9FUNG|nr:hypothetical protein BJ684DRAFT_15689 [Piptocephalis cylindrospora]|eukprot:RKP13955.1 hypothetical protein BJ684DRAFT_15689 [Piptocephalis cylindrospora]